MSFELYHKPPVIEAKLLDVLLKHPQQHQSIHALSQTMQSSLATVQHELGCLVEAGCQLDHHPQQGVKLLRTGPGSWVDYLQWTLGPHRPVIVFNQTASTQDAAKRLLGEKGPSLHGAVVAADQQYAGRGRMGRTWLAPPGASAIFSLIHVAAATDDDPQGRLNTDHLIFATAVAVARGLEQATGDAFKASIKWPNDVLIDGRKVAGILVETLALAGQRQAAVIGVGINVGQTPDLSEVDPQRARRIATSMADHTPPVDRLTVMARVLKAIDDALTQRNPSSLVADWRQRSVLISRKIQLQTPQGIVQGEVIDIDPDEGLIVRSDTGSILHLPAATTSVV